MSRFNKNAKNLSKAQEREWLKANATPVEAESKAEEVATSATPEATTKEPDEGKSKEEKPKSRTRAGLKLRRTKKGENDNG